MSFERVIGYYNDCHRDYQRVWGTDHNFSMHYGFYDARTTSADDAANNTNKAVATTLDLAGRQLVVDAGCGVGGTCIWLAQNTGAQVVGINIQPMQLEIARSAVESLALGNRISFERADFAHLPFGDTSVDALYAVESVCHCEDKQAFLTEAARVLKPGARVAIFDYFLRDGALKAAEERMLERFMNGWAIPNLPSSSKYLEYALAAGFKDISIRDVTHKITPDARRMSLLCGLSLPRTFYRVWRGTRSSVVLGNRISGWYQYRLMRRGTYSYGILTATR